LKPVERECFDRHNSNYSVGRSRRWRRTAFEVKESPQASSTQTAVQRAATAVAHLHDTMMDPASFVLDGVFIVKANRRGNVSVCNAFRSHNRMGGYSSVPSMHAPPVHGICLFVSMGQDWKTRSTWSRGRSARSAPMDFCSSQPGKMACNACAVGLLANAGTQRAVCSEPLPFLIGRNLP
jgi:hypothetical protein